MKKKEIKRSLREATEESFIRRRSEEGEFSFERAINRRTQREFFKESSLRGAPKIRNAEEEIHEKPSGEVREIKK